jgi:phosphoribosylformylglycinamidine synthase
MQLRAMIVTGYGINADEELAVAFAMAGAEPQRIHVADLLDEPARLSAVSFLAFPGGFSFGDHLGSGLVLANLFKARMGNELSAFVADGGLIIGICNGFQALVKTGLLPNLDGAGMPQVSLVHNASGTFTDDWVPVRFEPASCCVWTAGLAARLLPIRHGEGRFTTATADILEQLERQHLVAVRYDGRNPNGSVNDIAGICDASGRILGLMPHPEAFIHPEAHPWRRRGFQGGLGVDLFRTAVTWAQTSR